MQKKNKPLKWNVTQFTNKMTGLRLVFSDAGEIAMPTLKFLQVSGAIGFVLFGMDSLKKVNGARPRNVSN